MFDAVCHVYSSHFSHQQSKYQFLYHWLVCIDSGQYLSAIEHVPFGASQLTCIDCPPMDQCIRIYGCGSNGVQLHNAGENSGDQSLEVWLILCAARHCVCALPGRPYFFVVAYGNIGLFWLSWLAQALPLETTHLVTRF